MKFHVQRHPRRPASSLPTNGARRWSKPLPKPAEELMNKYLEDGDLTEAEIKLGIRTRTIASEIQPMLCGTAFKNKGVQRMLDAVDRIHAVADRHSAGQRARTKTKQPVTRKADDDEKFSALAFKLMTDPFVGQLTFVRVYSGVLSQGRQRLQPDPAARRSVSAVSCRCTPTSREEINEIRAGDIAACVGLKDVTTGETLCDPDAIVTLERMVFPEPVISQAVEPKTKADQEKMGIALQRLAQEDPSFRVQDRRRIGPDHHLRHGRAAPGNHRRPHEARIRRGSQRGQAASGLPRNDPQDGRRRRRQVRAPVGRQGPVRPRRAQDRTARSRQGLRVRRRHQGRCGSARIHPRGRKGRQRSADATACWPATRWWTSRSRCTSVRTTTWTRTKWRSRWPPSSASRKAAARPAP